jgi:hypothetical protein
LTARRSKIDCCGPIKPSRQDRKGLDPRLVRPVP